MRVIYAEKPDMGTKIAAALGGLRLTSGKVVGFGELSANETAIRAQRRRDGFFATSYAGREIIVTWGYGHLCELAQAGDINPAWKDWRLLPLPYIPDSYPLKVRKDAADTFQRVAGFFRKADDVVIATDNDREGDLIGVYVMEAARYCGPWYRAIYEEQSEAAFRAAFLDENLRTSENRAGVVAAGRARSQGDFLVGSGLTAAMTVTRPSADGKVLSVGRVQTAALALVAAKDAEIRDFKPEPYVAISGEFHAKGGIYTGVCEDNPFKDAGAATQTLRRARAGPCRVLSIEKQESDAPKPQLHSLQSLQMEASKKLGLHLDDTLAIAQSLYEQGMTTYPRTDSRHLTEDKAGRIPDVLESLYENGFGHLRPQDVVPIRPSDRRYFDDAKANNHTAIIPTGKPPADLAENEAAVYRLIAAPLLAMPMQPGRVAKAKIITECGGVRFVTKATQIVRQGHFLATGTPKEAACPPVREGDAVQIRLKAERKETRPPEPYTDATLLKAMMTCGAEIDDEELAALMAKGPDGKPRGLGRPSTQAGIVRHLQDRAYVERKGKAIVTTERGRTLLAALPVEDLKSARMTAAWEKRLDEIESGRDTLEAFMHDLSESVRKWTMLILENTPTGGKKGELMDYKCPACGGALRAMNGDAGFLCNNRACGFRAWRTVAQKRLSDKEMADLLTKGKTDVLDGFVSKKSGKNFSARLAVEGQEVKFVFEDKLLKGARCPQCGKPIKDMDRSYGCAGYPGCKFYLPKTFGNHTFTEEEVRVLLGGGTVHLENVQKKKGDGTYDCDLTIGESNYYNDGRLGLCMFFAD